MSERADGDSPILQALYEGRNADAETLLVEHPPLDVFEAAGTGDGERVPSTDRRRSLARSRLVPRRLPGSSPRRVLRSCGRRRGAARTRRRPVLCLPPRIREGDAAAQCCRVGRSRERAHRRSPPRSRSAGQRQRGGWAYAAALGRVERKRRDRRARSSRTAPIRDAANDDGKTPLDLAREQGHEDVLKIGASTRRLLLACTLALVVFAAGCGGGKKAPEIVAFDGPSERLVHGGGHQERLVRVRDERRRGGRSQIDGQAVGAQAGYDPDSGTMRFPYLCPGPHTLIISATGNNQTITESQRVTSTGTATGSLRSSPSTGRRPSRAKATRPSRSTSSTKRRTRRRSTRRSTAKRSARRPATTRTVGR